MKQTPFITDHLRRRLLSGTDLPARLTLAGLAKEYDVSLSPVRSAVAQLVEEGVLLKSDSGRLSVARNKGRRSKPSAAVPPPTSPADWDQVLLDEAMHASLKGNAVYLREQALARKHGIGRAVIRQALTRFAGAGLVEHLPNRGWRVRPFREEDMVAYLEIREVLELKALELARPNLRREDLQRMLDANPPLRRGETPRLNNELHQYLVRVSGNRYLQDFFNQYLARFYTALFDFATPATAVVAEQAGQHRRILQALLKRAWAQARAELSAHIWSQADVLRTLLGTASEGEAP